MKFDQTSQVTANLAITLTTLEELVGPYSPKLLPVLRSLSALSSIDDAVVYDARIRGILRQTDPAALVQNLAESFARFAGYSSHNKNALKLWEELTSLTETSAELKLKAASVYRTDGQLDQAETLLCGAMVQLPQDDASQLQNLWAQLAGVRKQLGNTDGAIVAQQAHLHCLERQIGSENPALISSIDFLVGLLKLAGRTEDAAALTTRRCALKKRLDGNGSAC